ncbi:MAG: FAD-dependent oxidoreductase, partial [Pseudomonadota bacterium]
PLPSVCGRICKHPCESVCKRQDLDEPIAIAALKRFVTDRVSSKPHSWPVTKNQKVAIVGSGPAGLSAAWDLAKKGYPVTVFESLPVPGGMLAVGAPGYRLPKEILQRDIDYLKASGIEIKTGFPIGPDLTLDDLKGQGYEAIFVAVGVHRGQKPPIPGADLEGIVLGTSFIRDVNLGKRPGIGNRVLVLGGGSVALDCGRTALRLGASEVHIACLENIETMPADASEIREAQEEGIRIHPFRCFARILGQNGHVSAVECFKIHSLGLDQAGQPHFEAIQGSEHVLEADTVIFAIGQSPDLDSMPGIKTTPVGAIAVHPITLATDEPGIFAGGDAAGGSASVIEAIASGQRAAASIHLFLQGLVIKENKPFRAIDPADVKVEIPSDIQKRPREPIPTLPVVQRKNFQEVSLGFSEEAAVAEAQRCLNCAGHLCKEVCPYHAPQFGAEDNAKIQMCNLCFDRWGQARKPICVDACPTRALDAGLLEDLRATNGDIREAEGFTYSGFVGPSVAFKPKKYLPQISRKT